MLRDLKMEQFLHQISTMKWQKSGFTNILPGIWKGKISQLDGKRSWNVTFDFNPDQTLFKITYPERGCSGFLNYISASDRSIDFREKIVAGNEDCADSSLFKLIIGASDTSLEVYYYLPNSTTLFAKGVITK